MAITIRDRMAEQILKERLGATDLYRASTFNSIRPSTFLSVVGTRLIDTSTVSTGDYLSRGYKGNPNFYYDASALPDNLPDSATIFVIMQADSNAIPGAAQGILRLVSSTNWEIRVWLDAAGLYQYQVLDDIGTSIDVGTFGTQVDYGTATIVQLFLGKGVSGTGLTFIGARSYIQSVNNWGGASEQGVIVDTAADSFPDQPTWKLDRWGSDSIFDTSAAMIHWMLAIVPGEAATDDVADLISSVMMGTMSKPTDFRDNCEGVLFETLLATDTQIRLGVGEGALFPLPYSYDYWHPRPELLLTDGIISEKVEMFEREGDYINITRNPETMVEWPAGTKVQLRLTAKVINKLMSGGHARGARSIAIGQSERSLRMSERVNIDFVGSGGAESFAAGYKAAANGAYSVAVGSNAFSHGRGSISIGNRAEIHAGSDYSMAVGYDSTCYGYKSQALGARSAVYPGANYSVALGYSAKTYSTNSGYGEYFNTSVGIWAEVQSSNRATVLGYWSRAYIGSNKALLAGARNKVYSEYGIALGAYNVVALNSPRSMAIGAKANVATNRPHTINIGYKSGLTATAAVAKTLAVGYNSAADALGATAIGEFVTNGVAQTFMSQPPVLRADNSSVTGAKQSIFSTGGGAPTVLTTQVFDLAYTNYASIPLPANCKFFPEEIGMICTEAYAPSVQPTIQAGVDASYSATLLAPILTSNMAVAGGHEKFNTLSSNGVASLRFEVTIAGNDGANPYKGRFYAKGLLIEDENVG